MRGSNLPPTLDARREELTERFDRAPGVLCCLDFDGTLAPIVDDPDAATMDPACRSVVSELATRDSVTVAVVSGRAIDDLRDRVAIEEVVYAGNHGLELRRSTETEIHPEALDYADAIGRVGADVADRTADVHGVRIEDKGVTATVHYREVADDAVPRVVDAVEAAVAEVDADLTVTTGKAIREIRPDVDWDKGRVVASIADDVPASWEQLYVGDDTTDEDAFRVVEPEGLGVLVGDRPDTAASLRIPEQSRVPDFLTLVTAHQVG